MRIALVVPGGVDRSGEYRVIPALLALIGRLSMSNDVQVIALTQEPHPAQWKLHGAHVHNIGHGATGPRAAHTLLGLHREAPFHVIQAIWSGWGGAIAVMLGKMLGIPSLVHIAGGELASIPEIGYGGRLTVCGRAREALTLRGACVVTAASAPVIETLAGLGLKARRVPLGVDLQAWPPREPVRRDPQRAARLIHLASLNRVKDQGTLLRALAALARAGMRLNMDVIGEDTLRGEMQSLSAELGLSELVRFRGFLPYRQIRPFCEAADLMVLSSRHEAGPLAMLEAAVAGIPTVGTAVGHIREWSPDAACSVAIGDSEQLAEAVARLVQNEDLRLRLAWAAHLRAIGEDADYTAQCFLDLYADLV